ncbi:MAG TPA: RraA family protein [Candidatus Acidoferrum sp.]|nr:RraA family protein [Candidatus Acidoferrum sp.]
MTARQLTPAQLEQFRRLSTCVVASAIETFRVRLPNAGFANSNVRCMFPDMPPTVGYAATARIRTSAPPMEGHSYYFRTDWWSEILKFPAPRIIVIQDLDDPAGLGAFVGEVHAHILQALGGVALVTNGAVRDLDQVRASGFQLFAGNVSVSHAYAHVFDFGGTVEIGALSISPGDLVQADLHGVQTIPLEIAAQVPDAAAKILKRRQHFIGLCRSGTFSIESLREAMKEEGEHDFKAS